MNERIKELAQQARHESSLYGGKPGDKDFDELYNKKFAELIVRECVEVCLEQRNPANLNYKPSEQFAEAVKQHFGVE